MLIHKLKNYDPDKILNILAFGGSAGLGLVLNIFILNDYGAKYLGVFSLSYAIFIFLSQISVFGTQNYLLYSISKTKSFKPSYVSEQFFISALLMFISTVVLSLLLIAFKDFISCFYDNEYNGKVALMFILPALFFLGINKLGTSAFTGMQKFRIVSIISAFKGLAYISAYLIYRYYIKKGDWLPSLFLVSEALVSIYTLFKLRKYFMRISWDKLKGNIAGAYSYCSQAFIGNILAETYIKLDILVLGVFASDDATGLYSFVSYFFEGFILIAVIARIFVNPKMYKLFKVRKKLKKDALISIIKINYLYQAFFGLALIVIFPIVVWFSVPFSISECFSIFLILMIGGLGYGGFNAVIQFFNQINMPRIQTLYWFYTFIINLVLNLIFVPFMGVYGAAFATMLTFLVKPFIFVWYLKKVDYIVNLKCIIKK